MTVSDRLVDLISRHPGLTEAELARALFGPGGRQSRINFTCRLLTMRGIVERRGGGGAAEPFNYHPAPAPPSDAKAGHRTPKA